MAQQGGGTNWILDPTRNLYYYHDQRTDEYVYQNGFRIPVPRRSDSTTPRTAGISGGAEQQLHSHSDYSSSPPREPNYAHGQRGPQHPPQARPDAQRGFQHPSQPRTDAQRGLQLPPQARPDAQGVAGLNAAMSNMAITQPSSRTYDQGGMQIVEAQNPQSRVRTTFGTSPASMITDPTLFNAGVRATRMLIGTGTAEGQGEYLYSNYRTRRRDFFCFGRVFLVLWVEPAGEGSGSVVTNTFEQSDQAFSTGAFNERVFSKVRRFVVIREGENYCSALPIATYGGRGVSKHGVKKSEHAIVYSGREAPLPRTLEHPQRGEEGMRPMSIRVTPDEPTEALDPMSRLDFGKVHTVQHNIKVRPFGNVHPSSRSALYAQFQNVWSSTATLVPASAEQASRASASSSVPKSRTARPTSGSSKRRGPATETVAEESDEDQDDDEDDDDDDDDDEEASSSPRSYRGRASSSQPRPTQGGRAPSSAQSQQQTVASSSGTSQAVSAAKSKWARDAATSLVQQGYSREQAFQWLVSEIQKQGKSPAAADAEVRALLAGGGSSK